MFGDTVQVGMEILFDTLGYGCCFDNEYKAIAMAMLDRSLNLVGHVVVRWCQTKTKSSCSYT